MKKQLNQEAFFFKVLLMLVEVPIERVNMSLLSKRCKIPRATLYYYFGSDLDVILVQAMKFGMSRLTQIDQIPRQRSAKSWRTFESKRFRKNCKMILKAPWMILLYFKYRTHAGVVGQTIREIEDQYISKMMECYQHITRQKPDPYAFRMTAYLKIGAMYGLAADQARWKTDRGLEKGEELLAGLMKFFEDSYRVEKK